MYHAVFIGYHLKKNKNKIAPPNPRHAGAPRALLQTCNCRSLRFLSRDQPAPPHGSM
jgi:hypothetical protein